MTLAVKLNVKQEINLNPIRKGVNQVLLRQFCLLYIGLSGRGVYWAAI